MKDLVCEIGFYGTDGIAVISFCVAVQLLNFVAGLLVKLPRLGPGRFQSAFLVIESEAAWNSLLSWQHGPDD